jgi:hypothetical protein
VTAVRDRFEAPFFLGPYAFYHRWFGTMFPDVEIAPDGRAHLAYTHDPAENGLTIVDPDTGEPIVFPEVSTTAEDGDIRYARSGPRRYGAGAWSAPVTVNDDGLVRAQGYPALETGSFRGRRDRSEDARHSGDASVHLIWEDHRLSPEVPVTDPMDPAQFGQSSNRFYDVFAGHRDADGRWERNVRVTDKSSISDFIFNGDYFDLTVSDEGGAFGIWTDRRHQTSTGATLTPNGDFLIDEAALEDNVFGARVDRGDDD